MAPPSDHLTQRCLNRLDCVEQTLIGVHISQRLGDHETGMDELRELSINELLRMRKRLRICRSCFAELRLRRPNLIEAPGPNHQPHRLAWRPR